MHYWRTKGNKTKWKRILTKVGRLIYKKERGSLEESSSQKKENCHIDKGKGSKVERGRKKRDRCSKKGFILSLSKGKEEVLLWQGRGGGERLTTKSEKNEEISPHRGGSSGECFTKTGKVGS